MPKRYPEEFRRRRVYDTPAAPCSTYSDRHTMPFRETGCAEMIFTFAAHNGGSRNHTMTFDHPATTLDLM